MALIMQTSTAATRAQVWPVKRPMPAAIIATPATMWVHPQTDQSTCTVSWDEGTWKYSSRNSASRPSTMWNIPSRSSIAPAKATRPTQAVIPVGWTFCRCGWRGGGLGHARSFLDGLGPPRSTARRRRRLLRDG